ncbi:arginine-hydroxylase NDUFAF5, mitochondrial isoform X2 [Halyomorpha halys]|uniref:arginine-hydroxylase NDUFAF5, mitochondrial isoform X2 n=1 Tax=Halyomorpha halys TaxID=286706 RepID=UPI0034D2F2DF
MTNMISLQFCKFSFLLHKRHFTTTLKIGQNVINVFDRKAKLIQKSRASNIENFVVYDYLKEEVGWRVADRILDINRKFKNVVDLGCGRGYISRHILADSVENLIMCDMSNSTLEQASLPETGVNVSKQVVNEEELPFEEDSLDLVVSSLTLHWVNDLPSTFKQVIRCLKKDGAFMGALFGGDTLYELRSSLQLADSERLGGLASHISPFTLINDIGGLLSQAGFTLLTMDTDELLIGYPSMFELIWDLKESYIVKNVIMFEQNKVY